MVITKTGSVNTNMFIVVSAHAYKFSLCMDVYMVMYRYINGNVYLCQRSCIGMYSHTKGIDLCGCPPTTERDDPPMTPHGGRTLANVTDPY